MITERRPSLSRFIVVSVLLTFLIFLLFGLTRWLDIPAGRLVDWLIGIATAWWLLAITTLPWNIYFDARTVIATAADSDQRKIAVNPEHVAYARRLAARSLIGALLLHGLSAAGLYALAASGISPVGYVGAGAALLLTGLRPALRGYEYIVYRLSSMHQAMRYPREDIVTLKEKVERLAWLETALDADKEGSWAYEQKAAQNSLRRAIDELNTQLRGLTGANQAEHRQLAHDIEHAVAQISTDGKVLEHARELVRFFKNA